MTQRYPLGSAIYNGKNAFSSRGTKLYPRGGGKVSSGKRNMLSSGKNSYPLVNETSSSGKWYIILSGKGNQYHLIYAQGGTEMPYISSHQKSTMLQELLILTTR